MQGLWIEACRGLAELADVMQDQALAAQARAAPSRSRRRMEKTYWLDDRGFYAFATKRSRRRSRRSPSPDRSGARRQARSTH